MSEKAQDQQARGRKMPERRPATTCCHLLLWGLAGLLQAAGCQAAPGQSALRFDQDQSAYTGLTFTFDPRLDRRVEWLHFDHWLAIMQHSSGLLYEALNGRAHLQEVQVLIPYKWRHSEWPVLHKPGVPIIANRRLRYADSDVIVGFEDPNYKETPFAIQHDECAKQGLHIHMPISFLEQNQPLDPRLKARLLVREFASHRYGIFKESGFRSDPMYPPFHSTPGARPPAPDPLQAEWTAPAGNQSNLRLTGFDEHWNECAFESSPATGLPTAAGAHCAPYLSRPADQQAPGATALPSFNLMAADPFSQADLSGASWRQRWPAERRAPLEWRDVAEAAKWHFCGDNFPAAAEPNASAPTGPQQAALHHSGWFAHNQLANNKQNIMCQERSALDIIRANEDFRRQPFSSASFNRLPATNFRFLQEMPPRLILCVEYANHLYQSRRLDHGILEAAINKFLAYDLIADTELALVLFGQSHATHTPFRTLEASVESRLALYSPAIDPYDEPVALYSEQELQQLDIQPATSNQAKLVKGTSSFGRLMAEVAGLLAKRSQYDDVGADLVVVTSGLFVEDEQKIEEILRSSASFRPDNVQLNLIIYPSTMLLDTKSRDGFVVLDALESEAVVRHRVNKLLAIQRLTKAHIHLVKEHLDVNGDVKMSTLVQFYQIFEQLARGHSWDQSQTSLMLSQQPVDSRPSAQAAGPPQSHKLSFQFELDGSLQHELLVGFIDPKQQKQQRAGKRFALKNLQLHSPAGQLVWTDAHPWPVAPASGVSLHQAPAEETTDFKESALFPFRQQLGLAGFQLKAHQLAQLANSSHRLAGTWTLTASADEPVQTHGVALARVNPQGDSLTATCWIQSYHAPALGAQEGEQAGRPSLRAVKVFMQAKADALAGPPQELVARLEVQDESGNIVQNVQMLDDGLGAPDMTRGDGIHSQLVQRAHRPGFYKVSVDLAGSGASTRPQAARPAPADGQDRPCCGSQVAPNPAAPSTRHVSRRLYCGTFHVDAHNKLGLQRPPRIANLSVAHVDQEHRRVSLRWFEPALDITGLPDTGGRARRSPDELEQPEVDGQEEQQRELEGPYDGARPVGQVSGALRAQASRPPVLEAPLTSRYEIKLFSDRDALRRSFDARHEVGFTFKEWNVEGTFPNASAFGGLKEVSLRVPFGREGVYFVAMKVYNNLGQASLLSNVASFWLRSNLSSTPTTGGLPGQADGQPTTVDADGNLYDRNGELVSRYTGLLRGTAANMDGVSILILVSIFAFVFSLICISLVACLAGGAHGGAKRPAKGSTTSATTSAKEKKAAVGSSSIVGLQAAGAGSSGCSSSIVSTSGCGSSQQSELASSLGGGSQGGHDVEINKLALAGDELIQYQQLQEHQLNQKHQAQLIQQRMLASSMQQETFYSQPPVAHNYTGQQQQPQQQWMPQHTLVNGYAYATVQQQQQQLSNDQNGDLNQNGLCAISPVQSWPADILLSHYDKVKQARERNEAPPVMRIETLEQPGQFAAEGLPAVNEDEWQQQQQQSSMGNHHLPGYYNRQLQQQLSSVLKNKRASQQSEVETEDPNKSTPALDGLTDQAAQYGDLAAGMIAPPQYGYDAIHQQTMLAEPSIYSQLTSLQQVPPSSMQDHNGYYANQQWSASNHYAASQLLPNHNSNNEQQVANNADSAISEV